MDRRLFVKRLLTLAAAGYAATRVPKSYVFVEDRRELEVWGRKVSISRDPETGIWKIGDSEWQLEPDTLARAS